MSMRQDIEFYSDGIRLEGYLVTPDDPAPAGGRATVIICSGVNGVKEWVPTRWYPLIVAAGLNAFTFDYRGFGTSDGARGRLFPEEEVEDLINAVSFVSQMDGVDPQRIGALGWGFGGGIVVAAAARDTRIRAVVSAAAYGDGARVERDVLTLTQWLALQRAIDADRYERVRTGVSAPVPRWNHADKDDPMMQQYWKDVARVGVNEVPAFTLASQEAMLRFSPEKVAHLISPRPYLIIHGEDDNYTSIDEAVSLYAHAREPKTLVRIPGGMHLEWIDPDSPLHAPNVGLVAEWFRDVLV